MLGAVVMGVGTAGRVRIRDMMDPLPSSAAEKLSVKGFVSRRPLEDQHAVKQISLEEALSRKDIQVAFICTENASHENNIRTCLQAGKHVCVEYPMALTHQAAVELYDLAKEKGVTLHEEHIELLSADYKQLKMDIAGKKLEEGSLHFTGAPLKPGFGFLVFSGISRLTWLVDLFGELNVVAATMEEQADKNYVKMTAKLLTSEKRPLTWIEERGPGLRRAKNVNFRLSSGQEVTELPYVPRDPVGLFMQDLVLFAGKLLGQVPPEQLEAEHRRVLHCLELADRIQQLSQG